MIALLNGEDTKLINEVIRIAKQLRGAYFEKNDPGEEAHNGLAFLLAAHEKLHDDDEGCSQTPYLTLAEFVKLEQLAWAIGYGPSFSCSMRAAVETGTILKTGDKYVLA